MQYKKDSDTYTKNLKIIPYGGVDEIGMNCTSIEYDNEIILIDAGLGFPENNGLGIDYLMPNINYLEKNKEKVKAIFITHGHLDHIGALDTILPKLKFPQIFASPFAAELIKHKLIESKIIDKVDVTVYREQDKYDIGKFSVSFFRVNHSTPDAFGLFINTPVGNLIHTGDFKIDNSPEGERPINLQRISKLSSRGVLALMSDSTNSFRKGFSKSESQVTEVLRDVVEKADGRVIVATFSQLVVRINQLLELAKQQGRKVAIAGRSLETTINIAKNLGYIKVPDNLIVPIHKIENFEKKKQMIFTTGHQGETMAALARIARDEHKNVKITEGDTVILSSSVIPGNDLVVQKMIDELAQKGAKVFHQGIMDLHTGGHGYQEDQKLMINLVRPRFFIPVHGFQSFLAEHGRTAESVGIPKTNVLIPKDGEEILLDRKSIKRGAKYRSEPILVMREKGGEIEPQIIQERVQLAEAGFITITLGLDQKIKNLATQPVIFSKGFSVGKNTRNFIISLKEHIEQISTGILNSEQDKDKIGVLFEEQINKFIKKSIGIDPLILIFLNFKPQTHEDKNNQA